MERNRADRLSASFRAEVKPGNPVFDQRAGPARVRREHRHSGGHGFNDGQAEGLYRAQMNQKIGFGQAGIHARLEAGERDVQSRGLSPPFQRLALPTRTEDPHLKSPGFRILLQGIEEQAHTFLGIEARDDDKPAYSPVRNGSRRGQAATWESGRKFSMT